MDEYGLEMQVSLPHLYGVMVPNKGLIYVIVEVLSRKNISA